MKKIIIAAIVIGSLFGIAGCNYQVFDFEYKFNKAYVHWPDGNMNTIDIKSWRDYEDGEQIQIVGKDGKTYLINSVNAVLVNE